jgi:hypothetical protein
VKNSKLILFKFLKVNFAHVETVFMRSLHQWIFVIAIKFVPVIQQRSWDLLGTCQ